MTAATAPKALTARQEKILRGIIEYHRDYGYYPTIRELMGMFRISSENSVVSYLAMLEHKGYIARMPNTSRGIAVLKPPADYLRLPSLFITDKEGWKLLHELKAELERRRAACITPEITELRLQGYDALPCPKCGSLKTVSSGSLRACDGCGKRWEERG